MSALSRIALLIDCDSVSHNSIEGVIEELCKFGKVNVRHAHGDWNSSHYPVGLRGCTRMQFARCSN